MENSRFPNRLKKYRRIFCLSQKQVARMLGLKNTSPLSRWEKGRAFPGIIHLFGLSRIYKTLPSELYIDLWLTISKEISTKENNLFAHHESLITNETYYL